MHPRNKMRLLAGLQIDHSLEITEAREVPNRNDVAPANEKNLNKKEKDLNKAAQHLENAVKALEAAPATDTNAIIPQIIKDVEALINDVNGVANKTAKTKPIKEGETVEEMDISFDTSGGEPAQLETPEGTSEMGDSAAAETQVNTADFTEGDVVLYDNGIWVVYKHDKEAGKVGIIPPDLYKKEPEECAKAMQMVDPGKVRKPNNAESSILTSGPDNKLGTADDVQMEGVSEMGKRKAETDDVIEKAKKSQQAHLKKTEEKRQNMQRQKVKETENVLEAEKCPKCGCDPKRPKEGCECTFCNDAIEEGGDPVNVVPQGKGHWDTQDRDEYPNQTAGLTNLNDVKPLEVKVPASVRSSLKKAIKAFETEANKQGSGATAEENRQFYIDSAQAFQELHDMLDGSHEGMQKAQLFAASLMGPMAHRLPADVWKFITNGGQQRSLKDYMNKV